MNTRIPIIALAICLFATLSAYAKPDKDDSKYTAEKVGKVQKAVEYHGTRIKALETSVKKDSEEQNKRLDDLERTVGKQAEAINSLISQLQEVQKKLDITTKTIDKLVEQRKGTRDGEKSFFPF